MNMLFVDRNQAFTEYSFGKSGEKFTLATPKPNAMKNIYKYSAFLFAVLLASAIATHAQSSNSPVKQETAQQVAAPEAFFNVESLDNLRTKTEEAYIKYQNATPGQAEALGAEFRHARRLYLVELEQKSSSYPKATEAGKKIREELHRISRDTR